MPKVIDIDEFIWLDFTADNPELAEVNLVDTDRFTAYVFGKIDAAGAKMGIGGYMENRVIYRKREHFISKKEMPRNIHLGIDLWAPAGTPVYAPLEGKVHSFQNNANFGDYGPTIVIEHVYEKKPLYTLYGHLSAGSLVGLYESKPVKAGEKIAEIGDYPVNGDWPPHLHFQVMTDMLGMWGDFPGVCTLADKEHFQKICPDPVFLLGLPIEAVSKTKCPFV